jgi:hypothetical protein
VVSILSVAFLLASILLREKLDDCLVGLWILTILMFILAIIVVPCAILDLYSLDYATAERILKLLHGG